MKTKFEDIHIAQDNSVDSAIENSIITDYEIREDSQNTKYSEDQLEYESGSSVLEYGLILVGISAVLFAFFNDNGSGLRSKMMSKYKSANVELERVNSNVN